MKKKTIKRTAKPKTAISTSRSVAQTSADTRRAVANNPSAPFKMRPQEVESALVTGQHADLLKRYFGEQEYAELQALARDASARSVRGGPRVLVLPGIMGSTLGSERAFFFDDVIWIDPIDIAAGHLTALSLIPGPVRHKALGVILFSYLKIKLSLKQAGYDADFHPFDWRQSLDHLGQDLAQRISAEPAQRRLSRSSQHGRSRFPGGSEVGCGAESETPGHARRAQLRVVCPNPGIASDLSHYPQDRLARPQTFPGRAGAEGLQHIPRTCIRCFRHPRSFPALTYSIFNHGPKRPNSSPATPGLRAADAEFPGAG